MLLLFYTLLIQAFGTVQITSKPGEIMMMKNTKTTLNGNVTLPGKAAYMRGAATPTSPIMESLQDGKMENESIVIVNEKVDNKRRRLVVGTSGVVLTGTMVADIVALLGASNYFGVIGTIYAIFYWYFLIIFY